MVLLVVPGMVIGLVACAWVLSRTQWSWWVRLPGCIVVYRLASLARTVAFLGLGIGFA